MRNKLPYQSPYQSTTRHRSNHSGWQIAGIMTAGCLVVLAVMAFAILVWTAVVALVWNACDLHSVFNAGTLSFWQCAAAGVVLGLVTGGGPSISIGARR